MTHIALLGDSIFDNAAYVNGAPDVRAQLQSLLSEDERATLLAVDGAFITGVSRQIEKIPPDATHLVISAGGNDLLGLMHMFGESASSIAEVLLILSDLRKKFQQPYQEMLKAALQQNRPTAICTMYNPRFEEVSVQELAVTALSVFNDIVIAEAFKAQIPLIDLRLVCDEDGDFANPIEPSEQGGMKIATAIAELIRSDAFSRKRTTVLIG